MQRLLIGLICFLNLTTAFCAPSAQQQFNQFVQQIRIEAKQQGISDKTIDTYLTGLKAPEAHTLTIYKTQPLKTMSFQKFVGTLTSTHFVRHGKRALKKYHNLLLKIQAKYHVQPQYIIAIWGIESDFGSDVGHTAMIPSLVTLSYKHARAAFYREELFAGLKMLDQQKIREQAYSTWDGGMGQTSFEPTAYNTYAVDFDGDGFKNIWTSMPDVFASIANYLHQYKWNGQQTWGYAVKLPKNFNYQHSGRDFKRPINYWKKIGLVKINNQPLPASTIQAAVLLPATKNGPAYLVLPNFFCLMHWNDTYFEAIAIGALADKIISSDNETK